MKLFLAILIICCSIIRSPAAKPYHAVDSDIVNKHVERTIDMSTQLVKTSYYLVVEHTAKKDIETYSFVLPKKQRNNVVHILFKDHMKNELKYRERAIPEGAEFLITPAKPDQKLTLSIDTVSIKELTPHPAKIPQSGKQLVRYFGNLYFYSPYQTHTQKLTVELGSTFIESYTPAKPVFVSGTKIVYGPFNNVMEPYPEDELMVHYENENPFLVVTNLVRTLEVSHWGNIAVTENIELRHEGAELDGSFSRYDFQKDTRSGQSAVKSFKTILPASASGVYYRDTNGNISTSNMRVLSDSVELEIRPRFPLFGGWRTSYTTGYNVPSFEYLFHSGDNFLLKMRVVDHIFDDMLVVDAVIKIILPEGSKNIKLTTPYPVTRLADELHFTYLDIYGRPVIAFTKSSLVENHISDFHLKYQFSRITMLLEPLLAIAAIFVLFIVAIICLRCTKEKEPHAHRE